MNDYESLDQEEGLFSIIWRKIRDIVMEVPLTFQHTGDRSEWDRESPIPTIILILSGILAVILIPIFGESLLACCIIFYSFIFIFVLWILYTLRKEFFFDWWNGCSIIYVIQ